MMPSNIAYNSCTLQPLQILLQYISNFATVAVDLACHRQPPLVALVQSFEHKHVHIARHKTVHICILRGQTKAVPLPLPHKVTVCQQLLQLDQGLFVSKAAEQLAMQL